MTKQIIGQSDMLALQECSTSNVFHIRTYWDIKTGEQIVLWHDIEQVYKNISFALNGKAVAPNMTDSDYEP